MQLLGLLRPVAVAAEDLVPAHAAPDALGRREDALDVDRAVCGRLGGVVDDDLPEIVGCSQCVRGQDPDLDEMGEVAVLVERGEPLDCVGRKRVVVAARDLEQRLRPDRGLQMDVELDLWVRHLAPASSVSARRRRRSISTESQIESSNRTSSGTASNTSETGSTVGSRIAITIMTT